ncbi:MAG: 4a-hydroxytetrahydrobiopterin dehydratase [Leptospirales bacterium]|nr:4a-hydroxytetrahydrobiopterin dehydratase [Leptospirales bacterium]
MLNQVEIQSRLPGIPGWELRDGKLFREFVFEDFRRAFGFMTECALAAEKLDHHPDWKNIYNRVWVELNSHDVGGITERDFRLATIMNQIAVRT